MWPPLRWPWAESRWSVVTIRKKTWTPAELTAGVGTTIEGAAPPAGQRQAAAAGLACRAPLRAPVRPGADMAPDRRAADMALGHPGAEPAVEPAAERGKSAFCQTLCIPGTAGAACVRPC